MKVKVFFTKEPTLPSQTGIQKREASDCVTIRHFENKFAVETLICS